MSFRSWGPQDIFESPCPRCGEMLEFFKIDTQQACQGCGAFVPNPRKAPACAQWCSAAHKCPGTKGGA